MIWQEAQGVTWIKVEKPTFDLVGVVLGSMGLAGLLAAGALLLGSIFGILLIRRGRRAERLPAQTVSLQLDVSHRPPTLSLPT
jgi:hypothetical protein